MSDRPDDPSPDEEWRLACRVARNGDPQGRVDMARLAFRDRLDAWAFVWDHDPRAMNVPRMRPHPGAVRVDMSRRPRQQGAPPELVTWRPHGSWALVGTDLDDLHALLSSTGEVARGWLVHVSTGRALAVGSLDDMQEPVLRWAPDGVRGVVDEVLAHHAPGVAFAAMEVAMLGAAVLGSGMDPGAGWIRSTPTVHRPAPVYLLVLRAHGTVLLLAGAGMQMNADLPALHVHALGADGHADQFQAFVAMPGQQPCRACGWDAESSRVRRHDQVMATVAALVATATGPERHRIGRHVVDVTLAGFQAFVQEMAARREGA